MVKSAGLRLGRALHGMSTAAPCAAPRCLKRLGDRIRWLRVSVSDHAKAQLKCSSNHKHHTAAEPVDIQGACISSSGSSGAAAETHVAHRMQAELSQPAGGCTACRRCSLAARRASPSALHRRRCPAFQSACEQAVPQYQTARQALQRK